MKNQKVIPQTVGCLIVAGVVLAGGEIQEGAEFPHPVYSALPDEITRGESDYQSRQQQIEKDWQHLNLSTLDREPEERRAMAVDWMEAHRSLLEDQASRSDALDALYARQGIKSPPDLLALVELRRPESAGGVESPEQRHWALERQLAEIRQTHAAEPEKLRDALHQWFKSNGEKWSRLEGEMRSLPLQKRGEAAPFKEGAPQKVVIRPSPNLPEKLQKLLVLGNSLDDKLAASPSPLRLASTCPFDQMNAWREKSANTTEPILRELQSLNQQMAEEENRRISMENRYETNH